VSLREVVGFSAAELRRFAVFQSVKPIFREWRSERWPNQLSQNPIYDGDYTLSGEQVCAISGTDRHKFSLISVARSFADYCSD
jgi:hypothetical protein